MTSCVVSLILLGFGIFTMISLIRWFEQTAEAVDNGWWNKVVMLLVVPPTVWLYPSKISAGRPSAVPHHEPVQGFGVGPSTEAPKPPPKKKKRTPIDPDMIAKLKQKMKDQGMLEEKDE